LSIDSDLSDTSSDGAKLGEDGRLSPKIELFCLNDNLLAEEEPKSQEYDNSYTRSNKYWEDLKDVNEQDNRDDWTLYSIDKCESQHCVHDTKVIGESINEPTSRCGVEICSGTSKKSNQHIIV
jgi:hypothetical protein